MSEVFREVDEIMRQERMQKLWMKINITSSVLSSAQSC